MLSMRVSKDKILISFKNISLTYNTLLYINFFFYCCISPSTIERSLKIKRMGIESMTSSLKSIFIKVFHMINVYIMSERVVSDL